MFQPKALSAAMVVLRHGSLELFDALSDEDLEVQALPDWTVADVFRHLADSDRGSVLGKHLLEFLPGKDLFVDFQAKNDANLTRLRTRGRNELRDELATWGRRMATIVRRVPARAGAITIPTAFGKLPISWMAGLRLYDEWVHQWDIARALGRPDPAMAPDLAALLGPWQLAAFEADVLTKASHPGVVEVSFADAVASAVYDLGASPPATTHAKATAHLTTDAATWSLLAAERISVDALFADDLVKVEGDEAAARALLNLVRVV